MVMDKAKSMIGMISTRGLWSPFVTSNHAEILLFNWLLLVRFDMKDVVFLTEAFRTKTKSFLP
jgi:hypothetical protein